METALKIECGGDSLFGVLHAGDSSVDFGVVIVVGGPQYRVGSHRQFVHLARSLADAGITTLRFDCRGMGDSDGEFPGFENLDDDIRSAVDAMTLFAPSVKRIALWGLCDGASAIAIYGEKDDRIESMVLVNPWVRSEANLARAHLKHHYRRRIFSKEFWGRLIRGKIDILDRAKDLTLAVRRIIVTSTTGPERHKRSFQQRMVRGISTFSGRLLIILAEEDMTAAEFEEYAEHSRDLRQALKNRRVMIRRVPNADHTFSSAQLRNELSGVTANWLLGR